MTLTTTHILTGGICLGVGLGAGYLAAHKAAEVKFRKLANEEIESVKRMYKLLRKEGDYPFDATREDIDEYNARLDGLNYTWAQQAKDLEEAEGREATAIREANEASETSDAPAGEETKPATGSISVGEIIADVAFGNEVRTMNIFDQPQPSEEEIGLPLNADAPRVITVEEYMIDELDFEKYSITYYDGDDTLADERGEIIHDIDGVIGSQNLTEFKGSTVIYVRNPRLESDYEVLLSPGEYKVEVQGYDPNEPPAG